MKRSIKQNSDQKILRLFSEVRTKAYGMLTSDTPFAIQDHRAQGQGSPENSGKITDSEPVLLEEITQKGGRTGLWLWPFIFADQQLQKREVFQLINTGLTPSHDDFLNLQQGLTIEGAAPNHTGREGQNKLGITATGSVNGEIAGRSSVWFKEDSSWPASTE